MKFRGVGLTAAGLVVLAISGCRNNAVEPVTQARAAISVSAAPVVGTDEPVTIEATGSFQADESSDVAPEASGRVVATPVDVGQHVRQGAILVRLQGVDAGLRLDEATRGRHARGSEREAGGVAERACADDGAALRVAARHRRRLPHGCGSGPDGGGNIHPERQHRARNAGAGARPARARREGRVRRRRGGAVRRIHQRAQGLARRVRPALDRCRHAVEDRSAPPPAQDSRRAGGSDRRGSGRHGAGRRVSRPVVPGTHDRGQPADLGGVALVRRRGPGAESAGAAEAGHVRGGDDRSGTHAAHPPRAAPRGDRGREHQFLPGLRRRQGQSRARARRAARGAAAGRHHQAPRRRAAERTGRR